MVWNKCRVLSVQISCDYIRCVKNLYLLPTDTDAQRLTENNSLKTHTNRTQLLALDWHKPMNKQQNCFIQQIKWQMPNDKLIVQQLI